MGSEWCFLLFFCLLVGGLCHVPPIKRSPINYDNGNICKTSGCRCHNVTTMTTVACKFSSTQRVVLTEGSMPEILLNITIHGGDEIIIEPTTFNSSGTFSFLGIYEAKTVVIKQKAFYKIRHVHLRLEIQDCNTLKLTENATKDFKNPFDFHVKNCSQVSVGRHAFSKLLKGEFELIDNLDLAVETFFIENKRIEGTEDTPEAKIYFRNVNISRMQSKTFPTAVNLISITDSSIEEVDSNAFSAMKIIHINFERSRIDHFRSHAFGDQVPIELLKISKCQIKTIESEAIMAAIASFTVEFSHITEIQRDAIKDSVIPTLIFTNNRISSLNSNSLKIRSCNSIIFNNNMIQNVHGHFLKILGNFNGNVSAIDFNNNHFYKMDDEALKTLIYLLQTLSVNEFESNHFATRCFCNSDTITSQGEELNELINQIYCELDECFELKLGKSGPIRKIDFMKIICDSNANVDLICETNKVETTTGVISKKLDATPNNEKRINNNLIFGLVVGSVIILALSGTIVILLLRGGLWLKRKGYCMRFRDMRYRQQEPPSVDDDTIIETELNEKTEVPELTLELIQNLRTQLENPETYEKAREMIEKLYEQIAHDDIDDKDKINEDELHLYEELGNLEMGNNNNSDHQDCKVQNNQSSDDGEIMDVLLLIEEKYNLFPHYNNPTTMPTLAGEYSEPKDAPVHLYFELGQNSDAERANKNSLFSSFKPSSSSTIALRPLPEKPDSNMNDGAGPSKS